MPKNKNLTFKGPLDSTNRLFEEKNVFFSIISRNLEKKQQVVKLVLKNKLKKFVKICQIFSYWQNLYKNTHGHPSLEN